MQQRLLKLMRPVASLSKRVLRGSPVIGIALAGCAHYTALPLATAPPLKPTLSALQQAPIGKPLDVADVVALALANNPDLRAVRVRHGVAQAQLLQSGILPNPVLGGSLLPLLSGVGSVPAWTVSLSQDIKALVTIRSRRRGAGYAAAQVDADILWQEWQVAGQARQLAADLIVTARSRPVLQDAFDLLARRNAVVQQALAAGNATLVTAAPTLVALQGARARLHAIDQQRLLLAHQLDALLGLQPDAALPLATAPTLPAFDAQAVRRDLATLADRRPDLLAVRLGYNAQDEAVRTQILAQFPNLILGGATNSDNARVINAGPQVSIGLPIFDRNQGNVAIANGTRAQLNAEYSARLASTSGQVGATLSEIEQLSQQLATVRRDLPAARLAADRATNAFGASNLDERSFVDLLVNRFAKEQEIAVLELALIDRQVALQTLVGAGLPSVETLGRPAMAAK